MFIVLARGGRQSGPRLSPTGVAFRSNRESRERRVTDAAHSCATGPKEMLGTVRARERTGRRVANSVGRGCPIVLFGKLSVDGITQGLAGLERRRPRGDDVDALLDPGSSSLP